MCIGIILNNFFSRRTRPGRGSNRSSATANVTLYCTWRPSVLHTGPHGQGNGLRVLASLMQRRRSAEVNQTLHDVWPSPALVYYIYTFVGSCSLTEFCQVQNSLCVQVLHSPILTALLHGTRAAAVSQTLWLGTRNRITELSHRRGRHVYAAGRSSC